MPAIYFKRVSFYLSLIFCISAHAQDLQQNLDFFSGKFISAIKSQDRARAYLVTDKSIFKAGESIWFRGFLLNSVSQKVNTKNKYFFVDLVNEEDSVISIVLLDAASQQLNGQIVLSANTSPGYYWLRAYTKQMAEGDTNNAFIKPIYVISKNGKPVSKMTASKTSSGNNDGAVMKFYPEGGAIITGANSTVAFVIQDSKQRPVATEGYIKDNRDSIAAHFISDKAGLGKFDFFPSSFRKYKAYINRNGKELSFPLPSFNFHAGQIAITKRAGGTMTLRVLLEDSIYEKDFVTYVIGVSKDSLCFAGIGHSLYELEVSEQKFPEGIATFYLFDKSFKFLSERSIYVKGNNIIVKASVDKNIYAKRDKVTLTASITDQANKPVPALFSVAVTDTAFANDDECITPDFNDPGSINSTTVTHMQCFAKEDVDVMMLIKNNTYPDMSRTMSKALPDDYDSLLFIKGKALDEKNQPVVNKTLVLMSNTGNKSFTMSTTDNAGRFSFPVSDYMDSTEFAIDTRSSNNKSLKIKIIRDPVLFPHFSTPASLKYYLPSEPVFTGKYFKAYLDTTFTTLGKRLPVVYVTGKKTVNYNESKRVSGSSTIITSDKFDERTSVGTTVISEGGLHSLNGYLVMKGPTSMNAVDAGSEPLLVIDGIAVAYIRSTGEDAANGSSATLSPVTAALNNINPNNIDFVEILKGPEGAIYGDRGGNGVILVNLSGKRKENFNTSGSNLQTFYAKGISKASLFPMVNYDIKEIKSSENFDNRSTVFWNGSVLTGTDDHVNLSFFTSDIPTTYRITLSGVTVHGDIIYKTLTVQSK